MKKVVHLISNAHIDPMWQWDWEEGAGCALSTFRVAAELSEKFDGYIFNHNEALLYKWVEEYEPELFERIQRLVKEGRWHIMGGWYVQPDCNMPSGEAFIRQIEAGRKYFEEKFGVKPTTAVNLDSFGHTRGLVQILTKFGYDSYLHTRPAQETCPLESDTYIWVGYDGSSVICHRPSFYGSALGNAVGSIVNEMEKYKDDEVVLAMWGVGNHGGGPSRIDIERIAEFIKEQKEKGVTVLHSTPEKYFEDVRKSGKQLYVHEKDLNYHSVGCYTSQVLVKQKYRELENMYFMTERMCAHAHANGLMEEYPHEELEKAMEELLLAQFHDYLPGTCTKPVEETCLQKIYHGLEIVSKLKARAFFNLCKDQEAAKEDAIPILVYNPHPFTVEGDFECEFMMWDQNWTHTFDLPTVYEGDKKLPTQQEKEYSTIPIDWRKKVVFHAELKPMQVTRFDCRFKRVSEKPVPTILTSTTHYIFSTDRLHVTINRKTGLVDSYRVDGVDYLKKGAFSLEVMDDNYDPWGMTVSSFTDSLGNFLLLSDSEAARFSMLKEEIPAVRIIEDGDVRTVVEAVFGYNDSKAVVKYYLPKHSTSIDIKVDVFWNEKQKMLKLNVPGNFEEFDCIGQVAFGLEKLPCTGRENVSQKFLMLEDAKEDKALAVINKGIYGSSVQDGVLKISLVRSASYTAHPLPGRETMPQERHSDYIDQGERTFVLRIDAGSKEYIENNVGRKAQVFNEEPMALSYFPPASGATAIKPALLIDSNPVVEVSCFRLADDGKKYILRLFNPSGVDQIVKIKLPAMDVESCVIVKAREFATYGIDKSGISEF